MDQEGFWRLFRGRGIPYRSVVRLVDEDSRTEDVDDLAAGVNGSTLAIDGGEPVLFGLDIRFDRTFLTWS